MARNNDLGSELGIMDDFNTSLLRRNHLHTHIPLRHRLNTPICQVVE